MKYLNKAKHREIYGLKRGVTLEEIPKLIKELEQLLETSSQELMAESIVPFEL